MPFAPYEPALSCRSAGEGATALMFWLDRESPWADTLGNLGVCNCRLPSIHSECRAGDSSVPVVKGGHPVGHELVRFLTECGLQLGIIETIFARSRRSAAHPGGKPYTGPSPHWDHVHWALSRFAAKHLNVPTIRAVYAAWAAGQRPPDPTPPPNPPTPAPAPQEDDDVAKLIRNNDKNHKEFGWVWAVAGLTRTQVTAVDYERWKFIAGVPTELDGASYDFMMRSLDNITDNGAVRLTVLYTRLVVDRIEASIAGVRQVVDQIAAGVGAVSASVAAIAARLKG